MRRPSATPAPATPQLDPARVAAEMDSVASWFGGLPSGAQSYFDRQAALGERYGEDWQRELADLDAETAKRSK